MRSVFVAQMDKSIGVSFHSYKNDKDSKYYIHSADVLNAHTCELTEIIE